MDCISKQGRTHALAEHLLRRQYLCLAELQLRLASRPGMEEGARVQQPGSSVAGTSSSLGDRYEFETAFNAPSCPLHWLVSSAPLGSNLQPMSRRRERGLAFLCAWADRKGAWACLFVRMG